MEAIMINKYRMAFLISFVTCAWLAGCGKKAGSDGQVFQKASPEIKELWAKAVADDQANNYVASVTEYRSLMAQRDKLTEEQLEAVNAAALAINQRLYAAANNGDAAAQAASLKLASLEN
jgi:hypothetical protein